MTLATSSGAPVGRTVPHTLDGSGVAAPVGSSNPLPVAPTAGSPTALLSRTAASSAAGNSGALATSNLTQLAVDVTLNSFTGGTAPTVRFLVDRIGGDGLWYEIWESGALASAGPVSTSIGPGCTTAEVISGSVRLRWTFGGTVPPTSVNFAASIIGR